MEYPIKTGRISFDTGRGANSHGKGPNRELKGIPKELETFPKLIYVGIAYVEALFCLLTAVTPFGRAIINADCLHFAEK
jgi:hypothetical protein